MEIKWNVSETHTNDRWLERKNKFWGMLRNLFNDKSLQEIEKKNTLNDVGF